MVFIEVVRWIAGVFGSDRVDTSKRYVEKPEMDEIVEVVLSGFNALNSRMAVISSEYNNFAQKVDLRLDGVESRGDDMFMRFESLQKSFDDLVSGTSSVGSDDIERLREIFNDRIGDLEKQMSLNVGSSDSSAVVTKEDLLEINKLFDEKLKSVESGVMSKVKDEINSIGVGSDSVATRSDNVATELSHTSVLPQQKSIEHVTIEKPVGVINTVVTEKSIKGKLPAAILPTYNILLNAEVRISYAELAQRIGKKEATARSYVNDLRKYGISIEEESGSNGRKFIRLSKRARQEHMIPE
ncbi:MAG: hypothetical protein KAJ54_01540 [Candidatus Aenigmarchaeota archaeon]|nr:hypothetical protein [Candidatus Aenigmarchaeota archaeon]